MFLCWSHGEPKGRVNLYDFKQSRYKSPAVEEKSTPYYYVKQNTSSTFISILDILKSL